MIIAESQPEVSCRVHKADFTCPPQTVTGPYVRLSDWLIAADDCAGKVKETSLNFELTCSRIVILVAFGDEDVCFKHSLHPTLGPPAQSFFDNLQLFSQAHNTSMYWITLSRSCPTIQTSLSSLISKYSTNQLAAILSQQARKFVATSSARAIIFVQENPDGKQML